ncbi:hypothetical protein KCP74_20265 [Salmonella enterica subsp. enterica]|nr:hypothetical protein KCP74_20265 [Salmonella enterica subsp. enterica]
MCDIDPFLFQFRRNPVCAITTPSPDPILDVWVTRRCEQAAASNMAAEQAVSFCQCPDRFLFAHPVNHVSISQTPQVPGRPRQYPAECLYPDLKPPVVAGQ